MTDIAFSSFSSAAGSMPLFPTAAAADPGGGGGEEPTVPVEKHPIHYYVGGSSGVWQSPDRPDLKPEFV